MSSDPCGALLAGARDSAERGYEAFCRQPVDFEKIAADPPHPGRRETTIRTPVSVTGPGTFFGRARRQLRFEPSAADGWCFKREDLPESLPIRVSVNNIWTTVRNIVLCSGSPHNYMRMVEHIVALRLAMRLDNLTIRLDSGDPPLFDRGSMDLWEALESAGVQELDRPVSYVTVKEPVTVAGEDGAFLSFRPCASPAPVLNLDCAVDFRSAIGRQRIRITVDPETCRYGALARTNTTFGMMLYCKTVGKLFADIRNLGYTTRNILVAGRRRYFNEPKLLHNGKSLEAVWHRAILDLVAAIALIERGRFVGEVLSYKSGHSLDVLMIRKLYEQDMLREF